MDEKETFVTVVRLMIDLPLGEGGSMSIGDPITAITYDGNRAKWDPYRSNK